MLMNRCTIEKFLGNSKNQGKKQHRRPMNIDVGKKCAKKGASTKDNRERKK